MTEEKFRKIYRQHYQIVKMVVYSVLRDIDFAEDVSQEVFILFFKRQILYRKNTTSNG